eukprot:3349097-Alexandrium_andersonii.AAC.1
MPLLELACLTGAGLSGTIGSGILFKRGLTRRAQKKKVEDARDGKIQMCLPHGQDQDGRTLYVEIVDVGVRDKFTNGELQNCLPVTIEHLPDGKLNVKWGHKDNATWALLGRHFLPGVRTEENTLLGPKEVMWAPASPPAPASAKTALPAPPTSASPWNLFSFLGGRRGLESHIPGSRYNPNGELPQARSGFRVVSIYNGAETTYWASTLLVSKDAPGKPYFLIPRHTIYALKCALERNHHLHIVLDHTHETVGFVGTEDFPLPSERDAVSLADALPQSLVDEFMRYMTKGEVPPEETLLYDVLITPCGWNASKAKLRQYRADFGKALGRMPFMRAFDSVQPLHNGVTCGLVPDNDRNRNMAKECGVVTHMIANSNGGSGSF